MSKFASVHLSVYYLVHSRSPNSKVDCELSFVQGTPVTEAWRWAGPCLGSATPPPAQDTPMLPPSRRGRCQGAGACPGEGSCLWTGWGGAGPPPFPLPPQDRPAWRNGDCCVALSLSPLSLLSLHRVSMSTHSIWSIFGSVRSSRSHNLCLFLQLHFV